MDPKTFGLPDMTCFPEIDETGINNNLKLRYENDIIYTYTGSILIAVNPYKKLKIFNKEFVKKYSGKKLGALDPHVFALAEAAYRSIIEDDVNQSCVISGESGAGKTESTKFILQYICAITSDVSTWVQQQILEANTVLEAFGNAKTVRNDNSSRFGKFMQIGFDAKHSIKGCIIQHYLLEQSRITFQGSGEGNYHVLYQMVAQGKIDRKLASSLHLKPINFYKYLNACGNIIINEEFESKRFECLTMAFTVLQIPELSINGLLKVLSAILWLGNLEFVDIDGENCEFSKNDVEICTIIAELLDIHSCDMPKILLRRQINVRGNITEIPLKLQEAIENRHAMAKALYSRTFSWLVNKINSCTNPGQDVERFFGVLDIFGFENFATNSFEQFCINYTNEKLHKFFNHYVFTLEQDIYEQEGITYKHVEFTDNSLCLELIEKPPRCILKLLTEQCHMPKGSDLAYLNNLHGEFEYNPNYFKGSDRRHWESEFGIKHYAGSVTYTVNGFVDKNRDVQQDVLFDYLSRSENPFLRELSNFQDIQIMSSGVTSTFQRGTSKAKCTVSDNFRQQLQSLIDVLQCTTPWYMRCIKPNTEKKPNAYDEMFVMDQLKYLGMLDIIRIRREGFPVHLTFSDFVSKYNYLMKNKSRDNPKENIKAILNELNVPEREWQIGKTKVFLRAKTYEPLEDKRKTILNTKALIIQKNWRCFNQRKLFLLLKSSAVRIQHAYKGWRVRIKFLQIKRAAIIIQSHLRGAFAREVATALREMRRVDEEMKKRQRICKNNESNETHKALKDCERLVQEEMVALSQMVDEMHEKLCSESDGGQNLSESDSTKTQNESIELDNLFAFLSEVTTSSTVFSVLDEINDKMDTLVQDFDTELANNREKQCEGSKNEHIANTTNSKRFSSLPEPTMPPPPPPTCENKVLLNKESKDQKQYDKKPEPIYEAVLCNHMTERMEIIGHEQENLYGQKDKEDLNQNGIASGKPHSNMKTNDAENERREAACERRKHRVEKKLQEMHQNSTELQKDVYNSEAAYDLLEFAENYFNFHERTPEGTLMLTLSWKGKKSTDILSKTEMITYTKSDKVPSSHIHMYDPENVALACNIFRDLTKYMKGELSSDRELQVIQYIIGLGIEREELRDEIFIQCIRQSSNNPHREWVDRLWLLMCLAIVAFQPSKLLFRYFVSYLKKNLDTLDGKVRQYAQWCFDNCKCTKVSTRQLPPSSVEVAAMRRLGTIVCRFFFLDGRTKAIDVHPTDTAGDAVFKLAEKLNLMSTDGWSIFQSRPDGEEHIKSYDYLYDIIAGWELKQLKQQTSSSSIKKYNDDTHPGENRFVFKKRLFKSTRELSQDPVEVSMLYSQAVYSVVKCDDFPVSEKVALQLAGLQAQVALGDPSTQPKPEYYADISTFIPERISKTREKQFWIPILIQAHRQYGASRNELTAKVLYLSCVMQYPLYGTTMFNVTYKGYWSYGSNILLGINVEGVLFIQPEDKLALYHFKYSDIESIMLDPSDSFITITLNRYVPKDFHSSKQHSKDYSNISDCQRCFVFETLQKNEIGSLIISYYPNLSNWILNNFEVCKRTKGITSEDRARLYQNVVLCRRQLADSDILRRPQDSGGFIKNTLRRLSKHRLEKLRTEQRESLHDHGETYKTFSHSFWAFSRQQISQSISKLPDAEESVMLTVFQAILCYSGLGSSGEVIQKAEDEHMTIVQSIMEKCMRKESLLNELYLQLIKQTTDHPDPNSRVNLKHWALLSLACSVILPPLKVIRKYLIGHLKRCASDYLTEEGKYARFAEKCFFRTQGTRRRQWSPSREEILCTINRRPCYAKFYFMDGKFYSIEFNSSSSAEDLTELIKKKLGLLENAKGYAIYEVLGNFERSLMAEEKVCDIMAKWEKYRSASHQAMHNQINFSSHSSRQNYIFLFKKHLFCDNFINLEDPVEKELLYHQVLHDLRSERFPITEMEAIMLTSLQGQLELGDYNYDSQDYKTIASHCLPPRFVPNIPNEAVAMHHESLRGMHTAEAKKSFLNLIQSWPLHRATIFDVMQSFTSNWPRILWLAVDQKGVHLLEHRSRNVLCTHDYDSVLSYSPNMNSLMIITGTDKKQSKVILSTSQAFQIATLIKEYSDISRSK